MNLQDSEFGRLLSLLSHELRAPVGVVRGYLRMLETAHGLADRHRSAVAAALRATDRAAEILDQTSALGALHRGETTLDRRPVALSSLLNAAVQATRLPEDSRVTLDVKAPPAVTIPMDEPKLRGAMAALIGAVVRSQTTAVTVELTARRSRVAGAPVVKVRIEPQSLAGIDAQEMELDIMRGGMGLDVPLAAAVVTLHGGLVRELRQGGRPAGLVVCLPVGGS